MAKVENGVFTYLGLPARFNPSTQTSSNEPTEKCLFCKQTDICGLILTRARAKREAEEDNLEQGELDSQGNFQVSKQTGTKQEKALQGWLRRSNNFLQWTGPKNMIDKNYVVKCDMTIDKKGYMAI